MKFAHMADLHLGGWRDPELEEMSRKAFARAVDICISEKPDFVIISGDFFDSSMPPFDVLDFITKKLQELKKAGIRVYSIAGSHDYSPSGKTILKVLENAELIWNVAKGEEKDGKLHLKFTEDPSGAKLTGIYGRKGSLDEEYYKSLDRSIESETGYKIFLFHSGIRDFLPGYLKESDAMPLSLLPKGFDYYAGGHIHHRSEHDYGKGKVVIPGALFPANFQELERFGSGGFYMVEDGIAAYREIREANVVSIIVDAENKTAAELELGLEKEISKANCRGSIVLIRASGTLKEGKPSDIRFRALLEKALAEGAAVVKRNTNALSSKEYEEISVASDTIENLEEKLISEQAGQGGMKDEKGLIEKLIKILDTEKLEGETATSFEQRIFSEVDSGTDLN
jgi:DNA repair protein SbcD/Mre11